MESSATLNENILQFEKVLSLKLKEFGFELIDKPLDVFFNEEVFRSKSLNFTFRYLRRTKTSSDYLLISLQRKKYTWMLLKRIEDVDKILTLEQENRGAGATTMIELNSNTIKEFIDNKDLNWAKEIDIYQKDVCQEIANEFLTNFIDFLNPVLLKMNNVQTLNKLINLPYSNFDLRSNFLKMYYLDFYKIIVSKLANSPEYEKVLSLVKRKLEREVDLYGHEESIRKLNFFYRISKRLNYPNPLINYAFDSEVNQDTESKPKKVIEETWAEYLFESQYPLYTQTRLTNIFNLIIKKSIVPDRYSINAKSRKIFSDIEWRFEIFTKPYLKNTLKKYLKAGAGRNMIEQDTINKIDVFSYQYSLMNKTPYMEIKNAEDFITKFLGEPADIFNQYGNLFECFFDATIKFCGVKVSDAI